MSKKIEQTHFDIANIKSPDFLSPLSYKELNILCQDIRDYILKITSKNGGHLSSNLGVVELTVGLHKNFDFKNDKLIFDVGHQCYTHKILTGRNLEDLRKKDGTCGFQKRSESVYDCYEAGHSSTSLSAAQGFAINRDLKNENYEVVAFIGDSSLVGGPSFEALNSIAARNEKVIIVLNDNGMSISNSVGGLGRAFRNISVNKNYNKFKSSYKRAFSHNAFGKLILKCSSNIKEWLKRHLVPITMFDELGFNYLGPIDGHNLKAIDKALKKAKNSSKSIVLHFQTIKGKGFIPAESDLVGKWHGISKFDLEKCDLYQKNGKSWSTIYSEFIYNSLKTNEKVYLISPATQSGSDLSGAFTDFKNKCIDVGICEEHSVTLASGLAINKIHPIISIYSTFMQRSFDQINHDLARMNLSATFIVDRSGLVGNDGETHQGIFDEAFLISTPNTVVSMASNVDNAATLYNESLKDNGVFFIRLPRENVNGELKHFTKNDLKVGEWISSGNENSKNALVGFGPIIEEIYALIDENNNNFELINAIYQNPINEDNLKNLLEKERIFIFDAYATKYGFINKIESYLLENGYKGKVVSYAIKKEFVKQASIQEQKEHYELSPSQILENAQKFFN